MKLKVLPKIISYKKLESWISLGLNLTFPSAFTEPLDARKMIVCLFTF